MKSFLETLSEYPILSSEEMQSISTKVHIKKVAKGEILQTKGDLSNRIFFVKKGLLRSYSIDENEKEHIFMFASEDWIMSDLSSHAFNAPPELYIDAVEDSEIEICPQDFFVNVVLQHPEFGFSGTDKLTKRVAVLQKRVIMLMSASARERYENFLETYPKIAQRVPQRMIASYLGITPEALSKIRGEMSRRKTTGLII